jgi:hypothetical protein
MTAILVQVKSRIDQLGGRFAVPMPGVLTLQT